MADFKVEEKGSSYNFSKGDFTVDFWIQKTESISNKFILEVYNTVHNYQVGSEGWKHISIVRRSNSIIDRVINLIIDSFPFFWYDRATGKVKPWFRKSTIKKYIDGHPV